MSQPVPPSWKDLGKSVHDLLNKDYHFSSSSLEVKTQTPSDVTFKVAGNRDLKTDAISGDIEAKWYDRLNGLTVTQAWTTSNTLRNNIELDNQIADGVKLSLDSSLAPGKGTKNALITAIAKHPGFHSRALLDVFRGPTFTVDTVFGHEGFLLGGEAAYNVTDGSISRFAAAVGYSAREYGITCHALNSGNTYTGSYYHRVSKDTEVGAKALYDAKATQGGVSLEVGTKTSLDKSSFVKAKVNHLGAIGLSFSQKFNEGVRATFSLSLDTTKLNEPSPSGPAHKVGLHVIFNS